MHKLLAYRAGGKLDLAIYPKIIDHQFSAMFSAHSVYAVDDKVVLSTGVAAVQLPEVTTVQAVASFLVSFTCSTYYKCLM